MLDNPLAGRHWDEAALARIEGVCRSTAEGVQRFCPGRDPGDRVRIVCSVPSAGRSVEWLNIAPSLDTAKGAAIDMGRRLQSAGSMVWISGRSCSALAWPAPSRSTAKTASSRKLWHVPNGQGCTLTAACRLGVGGRVAGIWKLPADPRQLGCSRRRILRQRARWALQSVDHPRRGFPRRMISRRDAESARNQ